MLKTLLVALALTAAPLSAQLVDGDAHFAARAEGSSGGHAATQRIDAAIAAYQRAIAANPNDLEARWKLLRSLRFKGAYVATSSDAKKQIYTTAKKAGEEAMTVIARQLASRGVANMNKASAKQVADAARMVPGAGEVFFWDAVNWGEWALVYGKMAAVREGAADRILRGGTVSNMINPAMEGGGPGRVLGRLHDQTPHVPFITGWASSKEAVRFLTESLRHDPPNKLTRVFLAEALVNNDSSNRGKAIQMLREVISAPNNPQYAVEDSSATDDARALLKRWGA